MSEWKEYSFKDIYDFSSGLSKPASEFGSGYPFLSFKEVFNNYFVPDNLPNLVNSTEKERSNCSVKKGDVFLTRTSETEDELGLSSVALKDYPNATFNGFTKRLRPKEDCLIFPEFVGYYLRTKVFRDQITSMASSTTRASLNNGMLADLTILAPDKKKQEEIAFCLRSIDKKIDLLHRQNKTLEQMAETLFRKWFVEEAKQDWEERPLSSIATFLNGLACQKFPPENDVDKLPVLKIKQLRGGFSDDFDWCSTKVKPEYIVEEGDVIFSWSASLMVKIWDGQKCVLNQHLFKVTSDEFPKWFYYSWCKHHLVEFISISASHATTMGHIKRSDLDEAMVLVPDTDTMNTYSETMSPLLNKMMANNRQLHNLTNLRDTLLPKLMSGEVKLEN